MKSTITHKGLKSHYLKNKKTIKERLKEFSKERSRNELFTELCFCICTPQSKALKVAEVIRIENVNKLLNLNHKQLANMLRRNTRFHNNKAKHIIGARTYYSALTSLPKDTIAAREFLVHNVKGLGYKESRHFLRNIGCRGLCIVDRHVINIMHALNVFDNAKNPTSPKRYLEMESSIKDYADKHGYDVDELDLALWSFKTGHVFK